MMSKTNDLRLHRLSEVAAIAADASLFRLKAAKEQRENVEHRLTALDAERRSFCGIEGPARTASADLLWQRWAEKKRAELNRELARARVAETKARDLAARDFGKTTVLQKLRAKG